MISHLAGTIAVKNGVGKLRAVHTRCKTGVGPVCTECFRSWDSRNRLKYFNAKSRFGCKGRTSRRLVFWVEPNRWPRRHHPSRIDCGCEKTDIQLSCAPNRLRFRFVRPAMGTSGYAWPGSRGRLRAPKTETDHPVGCGSADVALANKPCGTYNPLRVGNALAFSRTSKQ